LESIVLAGGLLPSLSIESLQCRISSSSELPHTVSLQRLELRARSHCRLAGCASVLLIVLQCSLASLSLQLIQRILRTRHLLLNRLIVKCNIRPLNPLLHLVILGLVLRFL